MHDVMMSVRVLFTIYYVCYVCDIFCNQACICMIIIYVYRYRSAELTLECVAKSEMPKVCTLTPDI